jgi:hypothetical protein
MKKFGMLSSRGVALFASASILALAAGGGAVAGSLITSKDIQDKTIRGADLHKNAVKTQKVKDGTLRIADLNTKARDALKKVGTTGPRGPQGPQGPQGPAGGSNVTRVTNLDGTWKARATDAAGLKMTGDGVQFGPFANGGACDNPGTDYARLDYSGLNGQPLSTLSNLAYTAWYVADDDTGGVGVPTMRVFFSGQDTEGNPNHFTFSPNTQFNKAFNYDAEQGEVHEWLVTHGTVRYNDDAGSNPAGERLWTYWASQFPGATISNINILNGCQAGENLTSVIREVQINGQHFEFGS